MKRIIHLKTISDLYRLLDLGHAQHPLIAVIDLCRLNDRYTEEVRIRTDFYSVMFKNYCRNNFKYGRHTLDFQDGSLVCVAPDQTISIDTDIEVSDDMLGWGLFFHPDLVRGTTLGARIREYTFFNYETSEALHLSEKEKQALYEGVIKIRQELAENIDDYSQRIIVSNLELLLNYVQRFYGRQFITRSLVHQDIVARVEQTLLDHICHDALTERGLPTVKFLSEQVNLSPNYLSDLLKKETGLGAQDHIHRVLIEEARNRLRQTGQSISEVAWSLGFEYPPYFSRLFKQKTGLTPLEYRNLEGAGGA